MKRVEVPSYPVSIFIAGTVWEAKIVCRAWCDEVGGCVTVAPTNYVYTGGEEKGVVVGFINYPRFPAEPHDIFARAEALAERLRIALGQESYSIQAPDRTAWVSFRAEDCDSGSDRNGEDPAKTGAECEASQSGAAKTAHRPNTSTGPDQ